MSLAPKDHFEKHGYVLFPNAIPKDLLHRWQNIAAARETEALKLHADNQPMKGGCIVEIENTARLLRYDDIFRTDPDALLELLATSSLMQIAREICGRRTVPLQADILYKHQHPHSLIPWHQGAPHDRSGRYLNVGIYLDDALEGDGCLKYVPGSQTELQDIPSLIQAHGWDIPNVVEQEAKAGDVLVQDMMILHGSAPKHSPGSRRTIYIEYRPYDAAARQGAQSETWVELRRQLMGVVLSKAAARDRPEHWEDDYPKVSRNDEAIILENILNAPESPIPSVYSPFPTDRDDYPVPLDFKLSS